MANRDIKAIVANMTIEEKLGQMTQINACLLGDSTAEITGPLEELGIPAEFLGLIGSTLNFSSAEEMIALQKKHLEQDPNKIPMLFMMDVIHGYRTIFPIPLALGASFDRGTVAECARMMSREAAAGGVHVTFAPMLDYARDARWGRVLETCGEDAFLNSEMARVQIRAIQGESLADPEKLAACVKHFAAYGGAESGRDYNTVEISERALREYYFPAYKAGIDAGARLLMPSFNSLNGIPSVANKWLMRDVLLDEWGYDGIVISDYNAIGELITHGVAQDAADAAQMAAECGCDIEMMSSAYCNHLKKQIDEGHLSESVLDRAVEKILRLKDEMGLFDNPYRGASPEKEKELCLCAEHRDIARRAAESCAILLKNDGTLPLSKDTMKIALIGPFADSHAIKGFWSCNGRDEDCVSVAQGVRALLPNAQIRTVEGCSALWHSDDTSGFAAAIDAAKWADAVVLCLGEPQSYSGEGNCRTDLRLTGKQDELARAVCSANKNTCALVFAGRPLVLTELDRTVGAILYMFFPGSEGGHAAAKLLFGDSNPSGKVSMSFPKATGQVPIYYNRPSTGRPKRADENTYVEYTSNYIDCGNLALYPFGHGLSYTTFEYESLELDCDTLDASSSIRAKVTLKNSGKCDGQEVVQLYMRDVVASCVRPMQSLIAFEKIALAAGERRTVEFEISEPMLRFVNFNCETVSEAGEFQISTGHADNLILTKSFWLK